MIDHLSMFQNIAFFSIFALDDVLTVTLSSPFLLPEVKIYLYNNHFNIEPKVDHSKLMTQNQIFDTRAWESHLVMIKFKYQSGNRRIMSELGS